MTEQVWPRIKTWLARYWPELLATVCALLASCAIVAHAWFLPPTRAYVGFVQIDQPVYYACAREYFENGNGLFAANPYSNLPDSPRLYSHLYFILVGWVWRLTGVSLTALDGAVRIIFTPLFLLLAARIFRAIHGWRPGANGMLALMLLGGGFAWLSALITTPVHYLLGIMGSDYKGSLASLLGWLYVSEFFGAEGGYGDWHLQLFRNFFYSPEVFYHVLFFGTVLLMVRRRHALGCVGIFLAWWAHPYTGLELALICGAWLALERLRGDRSATVPLAAALVITLLFGTYYGLILPRDAEYRSVYEQMRKFSAIMLLSKIVVAYGILPFLALLAFVPDRLRDHWPRPEFRLLVVWTAVAAFLHFHDYIVPSRVAMQALHFSHGYLYAPLAILALFGLDTLISRWQPQRAAVLLPRVAVALLILHLPDNVFWSVRTIATLPKKSIVFAPPKADLDLLRALDAVPTTETILPDSIPAGCSVAVALIPVLTHHRCVHSHIFNTPYTHEKEDLLSKFAENPSVELLRQAHATAVLAVRSRVDFLRQHLGDALGEPLASYDEAVLLRVRP
jgi:hypothetical protein